MHAGQAHARMSFRGRKLLGGDGLKMFEWQQILHSLGLALDRMLDQIELAC